MQNKNKIKTNVQNYHCKISTPTTIDYIASLLSTFVRYTRIEIQNVCAAIDIDIDFYLSFLLLFSFHFHLTFLNKFISFESVCNFAVYLFILNNV